MTDETKVMSKVEHGQFDEGLAQALQWRDEAPGDVLALVAMGEALEGLGRKRAAWRAYGSLIDLFPSRADVRRFAGSRLEGLGVIGRTLAIDTYWQAVEQRVNGSSYVNRVLVVRHDRWIVVASQRVGDVGPEFA